MAREFKMTRRRRRNDWLSEWGDSRSKMAEAWARSRSRGPMEGGAWAAGRTRGRRTAEGDRHAMGAGCRGRRWWRRSSERGWWRWTAVEALGTRASSSRADPSARRLLEGCPHGRTLPLDLRPDDSLGVRAERGSRESGLSGRRPCER